jgi:hypothetical protein
MIYELEELEVGRESGGGLDVRTPDEALSFYRSLLGRGSALAFVECAEVFRSFEMNEEALASFSEAMARDAGCLAAYLGRGELYFEQALLATGKGVQERALLGVDDFRKVMLVSLGSIEAAWKLGTALLIVGDSVGVLGLAENVLIKREVVSEGVRRDFLYLLGFARLFSGDALGAGVCAAELLAMEDDGGEGGFLKLAISIVSGEVDDGPLSDGGAGGGNETAALLEAGERLRLSGCREFLDVARALAGLTADRKG